MPQYSVKEIIQDYLSGEYPEDVTIAFKRWMLDEKSFREKDEALKEYWEAIDAKADRSTSLKLQLLHEQIRNEGKTVPKRRRFIRAARWAAAAIVILTAQFIITYHFIDGTDRTTVITGEGSKGNYALPDGSIVWLNESSRLTFHGDFKDGRKVQLEGEAYFKVEKDASRPFEVKTDRMTIEVLGTEFDVINYDFFDGVNVVLNSGGVRITAAGLSDPIVLTPDQMFSFSKSTGGAVVSDVDATNYSQWMNDRLVFENAFMRDVLTNLERWYNVEIDYPADFAAQTRMSFTVRRESIEDILDAMSLVLRAEYTVQGKKIELKPKK